MRNKRICIDVLTRDGNQRFSYQFIACVPTQEKARQFIDTVIQQIRTEAPNEIIYDMDISTPIPVFLLLPPNYWEILPYFHWDYSGWVFSWLFLEFGYGFKSFFNLQ